MTLVIPRSLVRIDKLRVEANLEHLCTHNKAFREYVRDKGVPEKFVIDSVPKVGMLSWFYFTATFPERVNNYASVAMNSSSGECYHLRLYLPEEPPEPEPEPTPDPDTFLVLQEEIPWPRK